MEVYKSKYLQLEFYDEHSCIEMNWLPATAKMNEDDYKQEMLNYLENIRHYLPTKVIVDSRNSFYPLHPALQEWMDTTIFPPSLEIGLNKAAIVESTDMIHQLSVEQVMEEKNSSLFMTRYFKTKEEAKEWLLSV